MVKTTLLPMEWLKEVPTALLQMDEIPLLGFPPVFPWSEFSEKLKENLQLKQLEVKPLELTWRNEKDLFSALGNDLIPIEFEIPSLNGSLIALVAKRDIQLIMSLLLTGSNQPIGIIEDQFQESFIQFLAYEMIYIFNQCHFDNSLNPHVSANKQNKPSYILEKLLKNELTLTQDISFKMDEMTFIFRLIIQEEFRSSWKEKYASRTLDVPLQSDLAKKIHIPVALEAGRTTLPLSSWKNLRPGDFLLIDFCSIDPENDKAKVMLTVNGNHFFRAKLKEGTLKILEHPLYFEGHLSEDKTPYKRKEQEMPKDISDHSESEFEDDFTFEETDEEESDHSLTEKEEPEEKNNEHLTEEKTFAENQKVEESQVSSSNTNNSKFIADEMMLDIIIEVGRLEMSIQKLTELVPGNVLEIDLRPENGVDLVVNGKRIGKGELLKVGNILGVRILDI